MVILRFCPAARVADSHIRYIQKTRTFFHLGIALIFRNNLWSGFVACSTFVSCDSAQYQQFADRPATGSPGRHVIQTVGQGFAPVVGEGDLQGCSRVGDRESPVPDLAEGDRKDLDPHVPGSPIGRDKKGYGPARRGIGVDAHCSFGYGRNGARGGGR